MTSMVPCSTCGTESEAGRKFCSECGSFLGDVASGVFPIEPVQPHDWLRIAELVWRYRDLPLVTVDASIVAAAERLGIAAVAALDRRHFGVVRPGHANAFTLLP